MTGFVTADQVTNCLALNSYSAATVRYSLISPYHVVLQNLTYKFNQQQICNTLNKISPGVCALKSILLTAMFVLFPAYIYHPESDACWGAYQRGPCAFGEYLILPKDSVIPVCMKNPCNADRYVYWGGRCERLGSITACADLYPVVAAVGVNATTLEIQCVRLNLESRFGEERPVLQPVDFNKCKPGSKLSVTGKCVK